jgi:TrmH family RNA methyltransferase
MRTLPLSKAKAALIQDLCRHKKTRETERAFVLEGVKPIADLLKEHACALLAIVVTPLFLNKIDEVLLTTIEKHFRIYLCNEVMFERLSDLATAAGILAVVQQPSWDQEAIFRRRRMLGFYGECLQDPANVGAIIRTAAALDFDALWLSCDSVDVFNPKVVRATTGALFKLPIFSIRDTTEFARHGCALLTAELPGPDSRPIRGIKTVPSKAVIALGNEGRGLADATLKQAAMKFHIPVNPAMDSLNVAACAAIAAFYFRHLPRQG